LIRGSRLISNVLGSTFYKGINILFGFLLVRFTIDFAGEEKYGIWLTLLSFFTWFSALEVGIGNSFRNQITRFFTSKDFTQIRSTLAKAYKGLLLVYFAVVVLLLVATIFFPVEGFFVPDQDVYPDFGLVFNVCAALYIFHFVFAFLNTVLLAVHKATTTFLISAVQNGILLAGVILFKQASFSPSLALICIWFSGVPLLVWSVFTLGAYNSFLKELKPGFKAVFQEDHRLFKRVNTAFLLMQLCTLVIFTTDNLIIVYFLSSGAEVARYNIVFKYFNILTVIFNLILVPYWASFTEAVQQRDKSWVVKHINLLMLVLGVLTVLGAFMIYFSEHAFELWLGKELEVSWLLIATMCLSVLLTAWNNIFSYFLNSVGVTRLQAILLLISAAFNVPLSIVLIGHYGSAGVIMATVIALLPLSVALPIRYRQFVKTMV